MQKILGTHVKPDEGFQTMFVAFETEKCGFLVRYRRVNGLSNYDQKDCVERGKTLSADDAAKIFPDLFGSYAYDDQLRSVAADKGSHPIDSLSDLYEGAKDDANQMILSPDDIGHRARLLEKLVKIRDLAAPALMKQYEAAAHELRG